MASQSSADLSSVHALVPVRGLADGKERLGLALDAEERETLVLGMLVHTLAVLRQSAAIAATHVISRDENLLALAAVHGASPVREPAAVDATAPAGLNAALIAGRVMAQAAGATAVLCLPADLPVLSASSIERLLEAADAALAAGAARPLVVIAPADVGGGTNGLLLSPPAVIAPGFGAASLEGHLRAAATAEASVQLVVDAALGFDLDTPADLERLPASRTVELLRLGSEALATAEAG